MIACQRVRCTNINPSIFSPPSYFCRLCEGSKFYLAYELFQHVESKHVRSTYDEDEEDYYYRCEWCERDSFWSDRALMGHIKRSHLGFRNSNNYHSRRNRSVAGGTDVNCNRRPAPYARQRTPLVKSELVNVQLEIKSEPPFIKKERV